MRILPISLLLLILIGSFYPTYSQRKTCAWDQIYQLNRNNEAFIKKLKLLQYKRKNGSTLKTDNIYTIPTVIHVIYKNDEENVSDAQIQSQLDVLNEDFRKLNADTSNVESGFSKADLRIEFCLAQRDPDSNQTTGITRTETTIDDVCIFSSTQFAQIAPAWDTERYLNIWVCDINDFVAGYAFPPGTVSKDRDGVVIDFSNFGTVGSAVFPYDGGRTATHEIGHWFNLIHPWGIVDDNSSCNQDDNVSDTPLQDGSVFGCPTSRMSCGSRDMLSNFMGFLDDRCMGNFTEGQKTRLRDALENGRNGLIGTKGCLPVGLREFSSLNKVHIFPNPISLNNELKIVFPIGLNTSNLRFRLVDVLGKELFVERSDTENQLILHTESLAHGLYFLQLSLNGETVTKKILVQR